jgi:hypothetical protein
VEAVAGCAGGARCDAVLDLTVTDHFGTDAEFAADVGQNVDIPFENGPSLSRTYSSPSPSGAPWVAMNATGSVADSAEWLPR